FRASSPEPGATFHLQVDGQTVGGEQAIPATSDRADFRTTFASAPISLSAGPHVLRIVFDSNGSGALGEPAHLNWIQFVPISTLGQAPFGASAFSVAGDSPSTLEAENFDHGGQGVAYNDATPDVNTGGAYRPDEGVDIKPTTDSGGGFRIS